MSGLRVTILKVALTVGFAALFVLVLLAMVGAPGSLLEQALYAAFAPWLGHLSWVGLSVLGMVRQNGLGWGLGGSIFAAILATAANAGGFILLNMWAPNPHAWWGMIATIVFLPAAITAAIVTHARRGQPEASSPAEQPTPPAAT